MVRTLILAALLLALPVPGRSPAAVEDDSISKLDMNDLRLRVEREEERKKQLFEQAKREREMLLVIQSATGNLLAHYRTIRDLKEKHLAVAVLDSPTVAATVYATEQIKKAQAAIIDAADPQQVQVALDVTAQAVRNLESVFAQRKGREKILLKAVPAAPVGVLRERAIETMNDLKKGLTGRIKAGTGTRKLMIRNLGSLKANLLDIDAGIRSIEKAGTAERVGEVLADVGFSSMQMKLMDRELGLQGLRGREMVKAAVDKDPVVFKQKALALMQGMRSDVKHRIKAEYAGNMHEIEQLTGLEAKLKRVTTGIREVEKAGTGATLGLILADIQLDLGDIDRLRTGRPQATSGAVADGQGDGGVADAADGPAGGSHPAAATVADSPVAVPVAPVSGAMPASDTVALETFRTVGKHREIIIWALITLGALLCSFLLSLRALYVRK